MNILEIFRQLYSDAARPWLVGFSGEGNVGG